MSLPDNWTLITVTGTYLKLDGTPAEGFVAFESGQIVVIDDITVVPHVIKAKLDENGSITVQLPSTNDPDLDVTGWAYIVHERIENGREDYSIFVEYNGGPIDLALVSPVVNPGTYTAMATKAQLNVLQAEVDAIEAAAVTDHGVLTGLADDDHPQYYNAARGAAAFDALGAAAAAQTAAATDATTKVAAEATLARNADNLTSGTVADARIASTIARDSEVTAAVAAEATARDTAIAAVIVDSIADGDTTHAPSRNAVFDALALTEPTLGAGTTAQFYRGDKTWDNYLTGALGLGAAPPVGYGLRNILDITGAVTGYGYASMGTIQSDATSSVRYYQSTASTQATSFTVPSLYHYAAEQGTFGAGSTVTTQYGYMVGSSLIGAGTNYGFYGNIPAGNARYNIYMAGTAVNYMAGSLGLGSATLTAISFRNSINITGATTAYGNFSNGVIQSDVTTAANMYYSGPSTAAASFTVSVLRHFFANQSTIGAGSAITSQYGFYAESTLTGATSNYGFYGAIASGTNRWNIYMVGTADNYLNGALGIGSATPSVSGGAALYITRGITGSVTSYSARIAATVQSDVTTFANGFSCAVGVAASAFTLPTLRNYYATQGTFGASSVVTNQYGFNADSALIGAAANYGFIAQLPSELLGATQSLSYTARTITNISVTSNVVTVTTSASHGFVTGQAISHSFGTNTQLNGNKTITVVDTTNYTFAQTTADVASMVDTGTATPVRNWAFYSAGTAPSLFNGRVGIGITPTANTTLHMGKLIQGGVTCYGVLNAGQVQSDATTAANYYSTAVTTQATSFTCATLTHYHTSQSTFGAGSTVTNQQGFVASANLTGATNNYGFRGLIASGSNRWNVYMDGTAANHFAGQVAIGSATLDASALLAVTSTTLGFLPPRMTTTQRDAISSPTDGLILFDSTSLALNIRANSLWRRLAQVAPRVQTAAQPASNTLTVTVDTIDMATVTAASAGFTVAAPTGTPLEGQKLRFRFKDNGTGRAITWNAIFRAIGVTLPTTTVANKTHYVDAIYNFTDTKWDVIDVKQEA